ncbi:Alcohol dehydrogenase 2 [Zhongshania aliphaticivorans]|uniref:Alcohol dehydrogenase 2 n=1 Tax=Zhongshania aliphaticivorans TaxID=1470434 RepID=A0A5S9MZH7_9GAMM|nr:iron-containing alcohol dehydrogenase [Zhongshania aliphaticivorans]CAA0080955.1 Alcohol dehydrogenase 2 [Zhongshania aliphaticivorans]CAA0085369.1 Alcohol dehydrogenase 2 [Zhongshania aliphaticivorans]
MTANINLPRILRIGSGASRNLTAVLTELGLKKPLLVSDDFIVSLGWLGELETQLKDQGFSYNSFTGVVPDPTTDAITEGLAVLHQDQHDCVVALGGGSTIDTAKMMAVMATRDQPLRNYKVPHTLDDGLPIIAIPTTAGTGSEATRAAVVTDTETHEKMLCMGLGLMPLAALVDFELTITMPLRLTADTGLDSLCHSLEAYVSRRANSFADTFALASMSAIAKHLRNACNEPDNRVAREAMMLAATQGGIAFSNASVTLIHGMSRPIGGLFHVPHGMSNAMLLPDITAWSIIGAPARYATCARAMQFASASDSDEQANHKLIAGLRQLCSDLQVPTPASYGIDQSQWQQAIPIMTQQALDSGSPANNPHIPSAEQISALYQTVWNN